MKLKLTKIASNKILLDIQKPKAGDLDLSNRSAAVEYGKALKVGEEVKDIKIGDMVLFKSFGIEIIDIEGTKYHFLAMDTGAYCGIL